MAPAPIATLFAFAGWKRRTEDTTVEEVAVAKQSRQRREADELKALAASAAARAAFSEAPAGASGAEKKHYSQSAEAVRKRAERALKKARNRPPLQAPLASPPPACHGQAAGEEEAEAETHYRDPRGRVRKRRRLRSRAGAAGTFTAKGSRMYDDTERHIVVELHQKLTEKAAWGVTWASLARELSFSHPTIFGDKAQGGPISRHSVRAILRRHAAGTITDDRGRPPALPQNVFVAILAALTSVVSARATIVSAPMLQPVALGVIMSFGLSHLLTQGRKGNFVCGVGFVRSLMKSRGWRNVKPQGDSRKVRC